MNFEFAYLFYNKKGEITRKMKLEGKCKKPKQNSKTLKLEGNFM